MMNKRITNCISGTALIAGTSIGAGMLGIPLITSLSGFIPAALVTIGVWAFMLITGLLLLEVVLWLPDGYNFLSISYHFLGKSGRNLTGVMFAFLYYCLMIAYFAAGAPLLLYLLTLLFNITLTPIWGYILFGCLFGAIVAISPKSIDRVNIILTVAMASSWIILLVLSGKAVEINKLATADYSYAAIAIPVLFSAFGYHNIIPSLSSYLKRDVKALRLSIILGTSIPMVVYLLWQWLIIGIFPRDALIAILNEGKPVTFALEQITHHPFIRIVGQFFALFAIITSTLGVAFSLVDFLGDGLKVKRTGIARLLLTLLTFVPPALLAITNPYIFDKALSLAGGFGEAFLNGILPISLVWIGRYKMHLNGHTIIPIGKFTLAALFVISCLAMSIEIIFLAGKF